MTKYRHAFGTAVTLAIMGYHLQVITRVVCGPEAQPRRSLSVAAGLATPGSA